MAFDVNWRAEDFPNYDRNTFYQDDHEKVLPNAPLAIRGKAMQVNVFVGSTSNLRQESLCT
jgi:hypothetical protein